MVSNELIIDVLNILSTTPLIISKKKMLYSRNMLICNFTKVYTSSKKVVYKFNILSVISQKTCKKRISITM